MTYSILGTIAAAQAIFLMVLIGLLLLGRRHSARKVARIDEERRTLSAAITRWLADELPAESVLRALDDCDLSVGISCLQSVAMMRAGADWDDIAGLVGSTSWIGRIRKQTRSRFWWVRLESARALAILATKQDLPLMLELLDDSNLAVQLAAASGLHRLPDRRLVEAVLDLAISTDAVTRGFLIETLAASDEYRVPALISRLDDTTDPVTLRPLLDLAGQLRVPSLLSRILDYAEHAELEVRIAAIRALGRYPSARSSERLIEGLEDPMWQVRAQAAGALGAIGAVEAIDALRGTLCDPNWWVRLRSALSLRVLGAEGADMLQSVTADEDAYAHDIAQYVLRLDDAAIAEFGASTPADFGDFRGRGRAA